MRSLSKTLLVFYLLILLWLVLFKFSFQLSSIVVYQTRPLNLIPFADLSRNNLRQMIYNLVVFIPFGLLLSINLTRATFRRRLAFICLFSLAVELIQFVFAIGVADITDVITNTFGGFLGLILYDVSHTYVAEEKLRRFIVVAGAISLLVSIFFLGILFSRNLRFHSSPRGAHQTFTRSSAGDHLPRPQQALGYHMPAGDTAVR